MNVVWVFAMAVALGTPADAQKDARDLLERWLDAQNRGDFKAYQALYAADFSGVRRSGDKTATFDRAGWMGDRARMFSKKMAVEAQNVRVFAKPTAARIVFEQVWSSGSYRDVGPKHLLVRRGPDGMRIFREELFASSKQGPVAFDAAAFKRFALVLDGEIVVSPRAEEAWASGPPTSEKKTKDLIRRTRRAANPKTLPPEIAQLAGARVVLFDENGKRCEAKIGAFRMRGRVLTDAYEGAEDAQAAWDMSHKLLVATVDGDRKACAGATWARSADLPEPPTAPARKPDPALQKQALAAFRALPESRAIQDRFARWTEREDGAGAKPLDWFRAGGRALVVRVMRSAGAGPTLVSASASMWMGDCSDGVSGSLWALWELTGPPDAPRLLLRNQPDESMYLQPSAAVDVDGDGRPEILFRSFQDEAVRNIYGQSELLEPGFVRALGDVYIGIEGVPLPIMICPC